MLARKYLPHGVDDGLASRRFGNAGESSAKVVLAAKLNSLIEKRRLSQAEAAHIGGMTQPKISQVRHYKLETISLERLMHTLVSFDQQVQIVVRPARAEHAAGITVAM